MGYFGRDGQDGFVLDGFEDGDQEACGGVDCDADVVGGAED